MLSEDQRRQLAARLKRIEGQVAAVRKMVEEDKYCVDILMQMSAARGALGSAGHFLLENHLKTCVAHALDHGEAADRDTKLQELLDIFSQYADLKRK